METVVSVSITGKFETLGSNFSQEIRKAKLLASIAANPKDRCILILIKAENNLFIKFTSFTLLEVVTSLSFSFILCMQTGSTMWFPIEKRKDSST